MGDEKEGNLASIEYGIPPRRRIRYGSFRGEFTVDEDIEKNCQRINDEADAFAQSRVDEAVKLLEVERDTLAGRVRELEDWKRRFQGLTIAQAAVDQLKKENNALRAEVVTLKDGKEKAPDLEMRYRRLLWETHFHDGRYGDDGEMQCIECLEFGAIDYKREPLEKIERACREALILRAMKSKGE
jgi:cell division protein FtsB